MTAPRNARYFVSLADNGDFLVTDRRAIHKRTTRFCPREFVAGQGGFDERTLLYPDYVHAQLWRLHESRQRAASDAAFRARGRVLVPRISLTIVE